MVNKRITKYPKPPYLYDPTRNNIITVFSNMAAPVDKTDLRNAMVREHLELAGTNLLTYVSIGSSELCVQEPVMTARDRD